MLNNFKYSTDSGLNLFYDRTKDIAETLVLTVPNNAKSIKCANRALEYCNKLGQPNPRNFWGYDGTDKKTIKTPEHLQNSDAMRLIKVMDHTLSITEVACFLSHIAAWVHCVNINKPVVILEHDSIMLRPFTKLTFSNTLEYLGHVVELAEELKIHNVDMLSEYILSSKYKGTEKRLEVPVTQMVNTNYLLILGLHNYAIDPLIAKRLLNYVFKYGLVNPADAIVEQHEFTLVETGLYAVQALDSEKTSTINNRKRTFTIPGVEV